MKLMVFRWTPKIRISVLLFVYAFVLAASRWLAYQLRFDFNIEDQFSVAEFRAHWVWIVTLKLAILFLFGQFSGLLSYFSVPDLRRLFYATATGSLTLLGVHNFATHLYGDPRGVILLDFFFSMSGLVAVRLAFRMFRERYLNPQSRPNHRIRRIGIIGAGDVGASLARELMVKRGLGMHPVAFFDDEPSKWHSRIHDIPVIGGPEIVLDGKLDLPLDEVIIAMPTAPAKRIREVVKILQRSGLKFETVPSLDQLATGQVKVSQLRPVQIQDLLGREPVRLETENIRELLKGRVVMVTGGGGSIGGELCRQIASFHPQRLLLVDQSEVQAFPIEQDLVEAGYGGIVLTLVADILDESRMRYVFQRFRPQVLFHAAAHKHVPMMECQPAEAIRNNTLGTAQLAELALEFGVDRFVLISTDKAINPTNVMGATKRLAEIFIQSLHASQDVRDQRSEVRGQRSEVRDQRSEIRGQTTEPTSVLPLPPCPTHPLIHQSANPPIQSSTNPSIPTSTNPPVHQSTLPSIHQSTNPPIHPSIDPPVHPSTHPPIHSSSSPPVRTKFMAVRFGNVLGSSGSVIPIFNKQIAAGGPVKVTHPEIMRYFMTIPEAAGLVLQSAAQGSGGEIFVLDMGKPVKIVDLARQLIELNGLKPDDDIEIMFTGLRPGEKLFEELSHKGENIAPTNHPKILRFVSQPVPLDQVRQQMARLSAQLHELEPNQLKCLLKEAVPEYQPYLT